MPASPGRSTGNAGRAAGATRAGQARDHLLEVLTPVVASTGRDLEDVTVTSAGRRSLVRVIVDADGGVDLDAVAEVSRVVSDALDGDSDGGAAFAGPYVLEVSSPGIDRPLTEQRHWRRAEGRLVQVPVGDQTLTGRIVRTDGHGVTLDVDGAAREIAWGELGRGRVQVEFNRGEEG
ncbi:MAG TPA: ribosome maturation factor RimP [Jatrophihabitantaceae bacterium]|jgi:ribosome maturation factor RimP